MENIRPTSEGLVFKRETSNAKRHTSAMYSVTSTTDGRLSGVIMWYKQVKQYCFAQPTDCAHGVVSLRDIADFCEWLNNERKLGNKTPD